MVNAGAIATSGLGAHGIQATTANLGTSAVSTAAPVSATGQFAIGAFSLGSRASVTVDSGGSVSGGWQTDTTGVGSNGLPSAGVAIGSTGGGSLLTNNGAIGALSDRAIAETDRFGIGSTEQLEIINNGNVTGFVELGAGNASFRNLTPTSFDIRHFADTDGDAVRDTKLVAISDFGGGIDQFLNETGGVVRLAPVAGATTTDATGYYLPTTGIDSRPLDASFYDFNREGLLQGQLVNLETFDNAGIVDLRGPVTGNTLVITSNAAAGGAPGAGTYVSDGGQLLLNTVLNDGIPPGGQTNSFSDMLITDRTQLGAGGATSILVTVDPASAGALTPGNGIELVEVRDKTASPDGAFVLGSRAASGAYEYTLFHGGVGGDTEDGNWYLRSVFIPEPPPGPPPPEPPPPDLPNIRVEVPLVSVLPALANRLGLGMIGTYHDRLGEDYPDPAAPAEPVWCKDPSKNYRCMPTAEQSAVYAGTGPRHMAAWGRIFGQEGEIDFGESDPVASLSSFLDNGPSYEFTMGGLQAGMDVYRKQHENGSRDVAGFYLGFGRITADVDAVFGGPAGSAEMNGYSLGGYWTHIGPAGWYVDAVLQGTRYDQAETDSIFGEQFDTSGWGVAASLEGGYPVALGDGWTIEPQAQLVYQHVTLDDAADSFGRFEFGDTDAVYGRLGARLSRNWALADGRLMTGWAHANVWSSFGSDAETTVSSLSGANPLTVNTDLGGTWGSFGVGLSGQLTQNVRLFASGEYNVGFDDGDFSGWGGNVGLKVVW